MRWNLIVQKKIDDRKKKRFIDILFRTLEKILSKHRLFARAYAHFFEKMTIDEFAMVHIADKAKVVNIGCGSLPHTLIILAKVKDWRFLGIDKDESAVESAKKMIDYYHLSNRIEILWANGLDFDVSAFDLIIVSHGVEPKTRLLEKLGNEIRDDSIVLYRTIWKSLTKVYGKAPIPENLKIIDIYDRIDGIRSLLLIRNGNSK